MDGTDKKKAYFTRELTAWHATENNRVLPWKSEKDPYKIWLSEVILQQTRALQGLPYYLRFIDNFPTIGDMAKAGDEQVFRLWQGLGYYNRCKNMLATARYIDSELKGQFPQNYEALLNLKGIGPYTAAAVSSFAFGLPNAVVDGNVIRILSRYFGIDTPFDITEGKKIFAALAQELLDQKDSSAYNQAIMDLGATVCTPRNPLCNTCPLQKKCTAYQQDLTGLLPVKSKKLIVKKRYFHYLLLLWKDTIWIHKRESGDIWENLHEPYLIESSEPLDINELLRDQLFANAAVVYDSVAYNGKTTQRLTHQLIEASFFTFHLSEKPQITLNKGMWLSLSDLKNIAFPKTLVSFLENNLYF